jgi:hypothetical protein
VASLLEACRGPLEQWAKTHSALDAQLHILGVVVATPQLWNAMITPGPKNKFEMILAVGQAGVWMAKVAADFIPGLQSAKPALVWTGVILKVGGNIYGPGPSCKDCSCGSVSKDCVHISGLEVDGDWI